MCICITESHKKILLFEIKKKSPMYGSFKITPSFTILSAYIIRKTTTGRHSEINPEHGPLKKKWMTFIVIQDLTRKKAAK